MPNLDRSRSFGTITPPWNGDRDEFDRPAHYEQDGRVFDAHGAEIVPGRLAKVRKAAPPPPPVAEPEPEDEPDEDEGDEIETAADVAPPVAQPAETPQLTPGDLLARVDRMAYKLFAREAKRILGPTCPSGKQAIVLALQGAIAAYEKRKTERHGMTWGGVASGRKRPAGPPPAPAPAAAPAPVANGKAGIDLAMWGRGRQEYLWAEVVTAIRTQYHRQIASTAEGRRDAVEFLIEQRVITAAEARKDV